MAPGRSARRGLVGLQPVRAITHRVCGAGLEARRRYAVATWSAFPWAKEATGGWGFVATAVGGAWDSPPTG